MNPLRMKRMFFMSSGLLLCVECANQLYPEFTKWSMQDPGLSVPHNLECHVHKIATAMGLPRPHNIRVFISSGYSSVCAGHTLLPGGAVIGLPQCVLYRNLQDIKQAGITLCGDDIEWDGPVGDAIAKLLLPSASHINFSIAHEVSHIQHVDLAPRCLITPFSMLSCYYAGYWFQVFFPHLVTFTPMAVIACAVLCMSAHKAIDHWQEYRADKKAAMCRPSYAVGGMEMMRKRIALDAELASYRSAADSSAKSWWTPWNNWTWSPWTLFTESHPPFSERLHRLQQVGSASNHYWGHQ